ncbi:MAG: TetR/AcrR family transcriptional regulator [Pseudomonadota bacterium]|nr:TetR/AcrR family transcriptional regulator [Hyphomicrobiales bacterium]
MSDDQPKTGRRASIGARRNPATEAAIVAAARDLLAERGYAGFSFEEVARRAGAGKPTLYRWWPTKADLLVEVYAGEKAATMRPPDTGHLTEDLVSYTRALWSFWRDTPTGRAFRGLIAEAQSSAAAQSTLRDKFLPERLKDVRALFEQAAARGEVRTDTIEDLIALYIGFNWFRLLTGRIEDDPAAISRTARLLAVAGAPQ